MWRGLSRSIVVQCLELNVWPGHRVRLNQPELYSHLQWHWPEDGERPRSCFGRGLSISPDAPRRRGADGEILRCA